MFDFARPSRANPPFDRNQLVEVGRPGGPTVLGRVRQCYWDAGVRCVIGPGWRTVDVVLHGETRVRNVPIEHVKPPTNVIERLAEIEMPDAQDA